MLHPGLTRKENSRYGQSTPGGAPSYPHETYSSTEKCSEHQVKAGSIHDEYLGIHTGVLHTGDTALAVTECQLAPLITNNVVQELGGDSEQPLLICNALETSTVAPSIMLENDENPSPRPSPLKICGAHGPRDTPNLAESGFHNGRPPSMTSGQASLFDALLSLADTGAKDHNSSTPLSLPATKLNTAWSSTESKPEDNTSDSDVSESPKSLENSGNSLTRTLPLDRNAESNVLPFILNAYASWATKTMFDPHRVIQVGRTYVFRQYATSELARWKLKLVSDFTWTAGSSTAYDLDDLHSFTIFQTHMCQQFLAAASTEHSRKVLEHSTAVDMFIFAHELFSMAFKHLPLSNILSLMQLSAPIFRRACPGSQEAFVHLPSLLLQSNLSLRYFAVFDTLMSVITNRPMFFRYNVAFTQQVPESKMYIQDYFGMQWFYGVPDRLVITLARMNALREDYGDCVGTTTIRELELEIANFQPVLGPSDEPTLIVSRLVVQECWRQAAYIYLYMGLCNADSLDSRVRLAQTRFMELFRGIKPGRNPDVFLILPIIILGIATHTAEEQDLIYQRMMNQPECSRQPTSGNDILKILNQVWSRPKRLGPVMWYDLRLACLRIIGM